MNLYRRLDGGKFHHLDAYRLKDAKEAGELDLENNIDSGPLVVEWADRISPALPKDHMWVSLRIVDENQRDLVFTARGDYYKSFLDKFRTRIYGGL
jgi:tRNA threonylcarbamoyladenosine biosynthesis protein TsaE